MQRKTKIVATLGPASNDPEVLNLMMQAGVDVVRLNFSHGNPKDHIDRAEMVRAMARARGKTIGVLVDLQGPKIRIGKFEHGKITLKNGDTFILDSDCTLGTQERVGLDYKELPRDASRGTTLLLDDGRIVLWVEEVRGNEIICTVKQGGALSNNKGINRQGGGLSAAALTEKDMEDIKTAAALKADYLAVSFPRDGADMQLARKLMVAAGGKSMLVAKIERAEAITNLDEILDASDAIMVARGDLGVEVGDAAVPALQKRMIRMAREKNKLAITATQMMESMINSPIPTRAEVSDVANAVIDGTDAVMLSAETAAGQYPVEAVAAMDRVCIEAEKEYETEFSKRRLSMQFSRVDESIAMATTYLASHLKVKAIAALTESGATPLMMSRIYTDVPIYALSSDVGTRRKLTLFRGVYPVNFRPATQEREQVLHEAEDELRRRGAVRDDDLIIITIGEPIGKSGGTNTMKIVKVGEIRCTSKA
ncbi:pyruvate kinase [Sulfuricella denitrificans skB26]|uniref:Pyruvate kinase n=1 Tax=Sulfuricella denitrificans (strain DSM 22764 / NBRC 105220 / skB26) TaxID=1163617 RepID=S6AJV2_SULDS|nr:pyruvate kinase [Sulfuricella denitrificans]BAN36646.1 pyruvate kinase [Sulfuricella denitrificans skB26]